MPLEYSFSTNKNPDFFGPSLIIHSEAYQSLHEIGSLDLEYVIEIVDQLSNIKEGITEDFYFGFELYGFECSIDKCRIINEYEHAEIGFVPFEEMFQLLKDWKTYLLEWDKNVQSGMTDKFC